MSSVCMEIYSDMDAAGDAVVCSAFKMNAQGPVVVEKKKPIFLESKNVGQSTYGGESGSMANGQASENPVVTVNPLALFTPSHSRNEMILSERMVAAQPLTSITQWLPFSLPVEEGCLLGWRA